MFLDLNSLQILELTFSLNVQSCIYLHAFQASLAEPVQVANISSLIPASIQVSGKVVLIYITVKKQVIGYQVSVFKMCPYLKTVRSSSEISMAYCSVGWVTINLLQHFSLLLISWALLYFRLVLVLLVHFEHFAPADLRLLPGRAVSGLGCLGAMF